MPIQPNFMERFALNSLNLAPGVMLDLGGALAFHTVALATKLGLFHALQERPLTATELAQKLASHERGIESLLLALQAIGYLDERDGRFTNSAMTKKWVLNDELINLDAALTFWTAVFHDLSPHAAQVMQTGDRPYGSIYAWLEENPHLSHAFQQQLMANATLTGGDIAKKLKLPSTDARMLDVGGGHGLFSIKFCQLYPRLRATVLDSAIALETAELNVAQHNLGDRIHLQPGDLWQEQWGSGYDLILLFNLIHHYDEAANLRLLRRCAAALKPGGQVAILDQIAGGISGGMANAIIRLIALHYFLLADGRVYAQETIREWFGQTGFTDIQFQRMAKAPGTSLIIARNGS